MSMVLRPEENFILDFRKRVLYTFATMGVIGNIVNLAGGFFSVSSDQQQLSRLGINAALLVMWIILIFLARRNRVELAAMIFCTFSTISTSLGYANIGLEVYTPVFYFLPIVIAAAFLRPSATLFYGLLTTALYIGVSAWLIANSSASVPASQGANIAILALILIATMILLFGFSSSLGRLLRAAQHQTAELARLNTVLQHQRQTDGETAHQVNELTSTLSVLFHEQDLTNQEQATMVAQVATTTQELDAAARKIADNALSVATVAEKAQRSVEVGQQAAYRGVSAISLIRQRVQDISDNMRTLNQQIERVSEVTGIIGEIADETNLLALNATIEAAGAREYGRRFAAVADEVQRLARRAAAAVEQIQETVLEINLASSRTMAATEQGLREAQVGDKLVVSLTVANDDVIHLVAQTSTLATSIAGATQQQRQASAQIVEVMQRIIVAANRVAQAGPEVSGIITVLERASEQLTHTADQLQSGRWPEATLPQTAQFRPEGEPTYLPPGLYNDAKPDSGSRSYQEYEPEETESDTTTELAGRK